MVYILLYFEYLHDKIVVTQSVNHPVYFIFQLIVYNFVPNHSSEQYLEDSIPSWAQCAY